MNLLERLFLITDFLFPAKTPGSEREKLSHDLAYLSTLLSGAKGTNTVLLVDRLPEEVAKFVESTPELTPLVVAPVAFQERYANRPFYCALVRLFESRGYSLFNLYNVGWKRGQIETAYALFIDRASRESLMRRIL